MLKAPKSRSSSSSSDKRGKSPSPKADCKPPIYYTAYDVDDTLWALDLKQIKNAHLLLPIMLFQMHAPNQHFGLMTNRGPRDNEVPEPEAKVSAILMQLKNFGIAVPEEHVIFAGRENAQPKQQEFLDIDRGINALTRAIEQLHVADGVDVDALSDQLAQLSLLKDRVIETRHSGKNFAITDFLNTRLAKDGCYHFATGVCRQQDLIFCMVDDLESIAGETSRLGKLFRGIHASVGGKSPDKIFAVRQRQFDRLNTEYPGKVQRWKEQGEEGEQPAPPMPPDDIEPGAYEAYYSDSYLFKLAGEIGLISYCESLQSHPDLHTDENALLKFAALLFEMHNPESKLSLRDFQLLEQELTALECRQLDAMLKYIVRHTDAHNKHFRKFAHFNGPLFAQVSESIERAANSVSSFLSLAEFDYKAILKQIADEELNLHAAARQSLKSSSSDSDLQALEQQADSGSDDKPTKKRSWLQKMSSRRQDRKNSTKAGKTHSLEESGGMSSTHLEELRLVAKNIWQRVDQLAHRAKEEQTRAKAQQVMLALTILDPSLAHASYSSPHSMPSSPRVSTSESSPSLLGGGAAAFTKTRPRSDALTDQSSSSGLTIGGSRTSGRSLKRRSRKADLKTFGEHQRNQSDTALLLLASRGTADLSSTTAASRGDDASDNSSDEAGSIPEVKGQATLNKFSNKPSGHGQ